jgi:hypothetical protein
VGQWGGQIDLISSVNFKVFGKDTEHALERRLTYRSAQASGLRATFCTNENEGQIENH